MTSQLPPLRETCCIIHQCSRPLGDSPFDKKADTPSKPRISRCICVGVLTFSTVCHSGRASSLPITRSDLSVFDTADARAQAQAGVALIAHPCRKSIGNSPKNDSCSSRPGPEFHSTANALVFIGSLELRRPSCAMMSTVAGYGWWPLHHSLPYTPATRAVCISRPKHTIVASQKEVAKRDRKCFQMTEETRLFLRVLVHSILLHVSHPVETFSSQILCCRTLPWAGRVSAMAPPSAVTSHQSFSRRRHSFCFARDDSQTALIRQYFGRWAFQDRSLSI